MADNDLNQNQQSSAAPIAGYTNEPINKPKIIDPLDEPLVDDSEPKHVSVAPAQSVPLTSAKPLNSGIKAGNITSNTFHPSLSAAPSLAANQPPKILNSSTPSAGAANPQTHNQSPTSPIISSTPKPADISSPKPQPNLVTPPTNPVQPPSSSAIPTGQFNLPSEELIAEEKQKIQSASPTPLPPQPKVENKISSVPPSLLNQPPVLNQK